MILYVSFFIVFGNAEYSFRDSFHYVNFIGYLFFISSLYLLGEQPTTS